MTAASESDGHGDVETRAAEPSLADMVATAVLAIPGVDSLHSGQFGEAATYLPGRRVEGVQVRQQSTHVHVVLTWGANIPLTADTIKATVEPIVGTRVDVTVHDLTDAPQP